MIVTAINIRKIWKNVLIQSPASLQQHLRRWRLLQNTLQRALLSIVTSHSHMRNHPSSHLLKHTRVVSINIKLLISITIILFDSKINTETKVHRLSQTHVKWRIPVFPCETILLKKYKNLPAVSGPLGVSNSSTEGTDFLRMLFLVASGFNHLGSQWKQTALTS